MDKLRMRFEKSGRAVYISHLDLMHTMQRAFNRAELPLRYSEGFNPHPQISIALPMSVGASSECEIMDFRLREDTDPSEIPGRMNPVLPEGIRVLSCYVPERKPAEIKWLKISGTFEYDSLRPEDVVPQLEEFFSRSEIVIMKRTKRGTGETDIRPSIREIAFSAVPEGAALNAVISAQEPTLNPELLADALRQLKPELAPDFAKFRRLEIFDKDLRPYA